MKRNIVYITAIISAFLLSNQSTAVEPAAYGKVDVRSAIDSLPETSDKPFVEKRLVDNGEVGIRVFRVYNPVSRHNHAYSSTYLHITSGKAIFSLEGQEPFTAGAGDLVFWDRGVDHEVLSITEHPLVFLAIDAPTRRKGDVQR